MNQHVPSGSLPPRTLAIGPVAVADLDEAGATAFVARRLASSEHLKLAFCNAHVVNLAWTDEAFRSALARCLVLADGVGVDIARRWLHDSAFPDNLNGTDFIPHLLGALAPGCSVALLGARPGVAERAAAALSARHPGHSFSVAGHGYQDEAGMAATLESLAQSPPDILLVAFGNPRQELLIAHRIDGRHAVLAAGVGALFDFLAGEVPRAPALVRRLRLEWLFRLAVEPRRLWRRYVVGNVTFLARILTSRRLR